MIADTTTAKHVSELMLDISARLDESVATVNKNCSPEEDAMDRRAVGRIPGRIALRVAGFVPELELALSEDRLGPHMRRLVFVTKLPGSGQGTKSKK